MYTLSKLYDMLWKVKYISYFIQSCGLSHFINIHLSYPTRERNTDESAREYSWKSSNDRRFSFFFPLFSRFRPRTIRMLVSCSGIIVLEQTVSRARSSSSMQREPILDYEEFASLQLDKPVTDLRVRPHPFVSFPVTDRSDNLT